MFSFVYFQVPEITSSQYSRTSKNVCHNHLTGTIFKIQTLNYLETFGYHTKFIHLSNCSNNFIFQLCTRSRMCLLFNWQTCKLSIYMFFIFSFVHALVCANCKVILVIFIQKKKKKTEKNDPYFGMGRNTKVMPQNAPLSIFSLGKGREYLRLKPYEKLSVQVHFLTCPQHALFRKSVDDTPQNCPKMYISCESCTFPVTEGNKIWYSFQIMPPTRKLTQDMNFGHSKIIHHFRPENPQIRTQDMNFGHSKIIHHFGPENPQTSNLNPK